MKAAASTTVHQRNEKRQLCDDDSTDRRPSAFSARSRPWRRTSQRRLGAFQKRLRYMGGLATKSLSASNGQISPGHSFSRFHPQLTCWGKTLLPRLRTGVCNLDIYCVHCDPDKELCKCGEIESREHFLFFYPLYTAPCASLPPISSLLNNPSASKATLRYLANSG